jgi:hypothetical protein
VFDSSNPPLIYPRRDLIYLIHLFILKNVGLINQAPTPREKA